MSGVLVQYDDHYRDTFMPRFLWSTKQDEEAAKAAVNGLYRSRSL